LSSISISELSAFIKSNIFGLILGEVGLGIKAFLVVLHQSDLVLLDNWWLSNGVSASRLSLAPSPSAASSGTSTGDVTSSCAFVSGQFFINKAVIKSKDLDGSKLQSCGEFVLSDDDVISDNGLAAVYCVNTFGFSVGWESSAESITNVHFGIS